MLPKKFKVPIARFPKASKVVVRDDYVTIRSAPNNLPFNRLGVTFRSKAIKTSVFRNKLKREAFNSFRVSKNFLAKTPPNSGRDIVIVFNSLAQSALESGKLKEILEKYESQVVKINKDA